MTNVEDAVIAKLEKEGNVFEILVDCENAIKLRQGKEVDLSDVLVTTDIFKDVKKGEHASDLGKFFGTEDVNQIAKEIIMKGEVQLTSEFKQKLREEKKKQIINLIHRNSVDPKTNIPHPLQRIENVMNEAKVKIDEFRSVEEQTQNIVEKIRSLIPIKFEVKEVELKIPAQYSGQAFGAIKKFGKVLRNNWENNGDLVIVIEVPAGIEQDLYEEMNNITHGNIESSVLNTR